MIAMLTGRIAEKSAAHCLLDVGGVGFRLAMSTVSLAALPAVGDEVTVHTYLHVREDDLSLFGFENVAEKTAFESLITVSGVGPKVALAVLSTLSAHVLAGAVAAGDVALLASVPGIGKKTAQRIIVDLTDRLESTGAAPSGTDAGSADHMAAAEVREALLSMGFSAAEVSVALKDAPSGQSQTVLRYALQRLGGGS